MNSSNINLKKKISKIQPIISENIYSVDSKEYKTLYNNNNNNNNGIFKNIFDIEKFTIFDDFNYIGCGVEHSYIATRTGIYFFGSNKENQLGIENYNKTPHIKDNIIITHKKINMNEIFKISTGGYHTLIMLSKKKIKNKKIKK